MQRTSHNKDCINIFHTEDGDNIAEYIQSKLTDEKYKVNVNLHNISVQNDPNFGKCVQVICLTPEFYIKIVEGKLSNFLSKFADSTSLLLLYHSDINIENDKTRQTIYENLPNNAAWRFIPLGNDDYQFKRALLEILNNVDQPKPLPALKHFTLIPSTIWNTEDDVFIILRKQVSLHEMEVRVSDNAIERKIETLRQINATTFVFKPSGMSAGKKNVKVIIAGKHAGHSSLEIKAKLDMLHQLLIDVTNPIELLCQTLNLDGNRESLDLDLNDIFTNGGKNPMAEFADANFGFTIGGQSNAELPTFLHFAAKYGLEQLCSTLLTFPGGIAAQRIKNKDGKTPYLLAIFSGYTDLADKVLLTNEKDSGDDTVFGDVQDEDNYMTMQAVPTIGKSVSIDRKPTLPPRSRSLDSADAPMQEIYENVELRRRSGIIGRHSSHSEVDSGAFSSSSSTVTSWTLNDESEFFERNAKMSYRMTKLIEDKVKLPRLAQPVSPTNRNSLHTTKL